MKKLVAALCAAAAMGVAPVIMTPVANADICGDVGGRHVEVGGCTDVAGHVGVALADANDAAWQAATGQPPCYTPLGVPYYTPGDDPCY